MRNAPEVFLRCLGALPSNRGPILDHIVDILDQPRQKYIYIYIYVYIYIYTYWNKYIYTNVLVRVSSLRTGFPSSRASCQLGSNLFENIAPVVLWPLGRAKNTTPAVLWPLGRSKGLLDLVLAARTCRALATWALEEAA